MLNPGDNMRNYFLLIFTLIFLISGCVNHPGIQNTPLKTALPRESGKVNFWLDEETGTVHRTETVEGVEQVVSIIKYKDEKPLEVMKILSSQNKNGKIRWSYFVPSTQYVVELIAISLSENEISIEWKNRNAEGDEDSGTDHFLRCNETGLIPGKNIDKDVEQTDQADGFSSFDNEN